MGARAWMAILGLGLVSVFLLGFMTKFAIDSSPDLQAIIKFKAAFAKEFEPRGVEEVSLRKGRDRGSSHTLHVTMPRSLAEGNAAALDMEFAEYFVTQFAPQGPGQLRIAYDTPKVFGCAGSNVFRETELSLPAVRLRLTDRDAGKRVGEKSMKALGLRLLECRREENRLTADFEWALDAAFTREGAPSKAEAILRQEFRHQPPPLLRLRFFHPPASSGDLPALVGEEFYDGRGAPVSPERIPR